MKEELLPAKLVTYGFSDSLNPDDPRQKAFKKQRLERGFDNTELWSLDVTIAKFILPRLKEFKNQTCGIPGCIEQNGDEGLEVWKNIIQQMIDAFEFIADDVCIPTEEEQRKISLGLDLFRQHFYSLWW